MDCEEGFALWNWLWGQTGAKSRLTSLWGFRAFEHCRRKSRLRPLDQSQGSDTSAHACVRACVCGLNELKRACGMSSRSTSVHLCIPIIAAMGAERVIENKKKQMHWVKNWSEFYSFYSPPSILCFPLLHHACHSVVISQPPVHVCQIQPKLSVCLLLWTGKKRLSMTAFFKVKFVSPRWRQTCVWMYLTAAFVVLGFSKRHTCHLPFTLSQELNSSLCAEVIWFLVESRLRPIIWAVIF